MAPRNYFPVWIRIKICNSIQDSDLALDPLIFNAKIFGFSYCLQLHRHIRYIMTCMFYN
jgi:hypothetical protein